MTVTRGAWGTTPASHTAGDQLNAGANSLSPNLKKDLQTDGQVTARYLFTWDHYPTSSYVGTGLANHKEFQIAFAKSGQQGWETQTRFAGDHSCCPSSFTQGVDVASVTARSYWQSVQQTFINDPLRPMQGDPWVLKPNRWTRYWVYIEANADTDDTKWVSGTTLASAITDTTTTTISVVQPSTTETNPFSQTPSGHIKNRRIRIGSEVMSIVDGAGTGTAPRTLTVVRGVAGTPSTHAFGATVEIIDDYISMWAADENTEPAMLYDNFRGYLPNSVAGTPITSQGGIMEFWIEFNTSTAAMAIGRALGADLAPGGTGEDADFRTLVAYVRNLVVLKDPPTDWSSLRVKPVR
jgi:hypothetical protein